MKPLELFQYNLNDQVPFAMPIAIGKVHTECHDPVGMHKAMDSSTAYIAINLAVYNFFKDF